MIVLLLFLQKQNLAYAVYQFGYSASSAPKTVFAVRLHKRMYAVMPAADLVSNPYAVSVPQLLALPEECMRQCIPKDGNFHNLLRVSQMFKEVTKDTTRDVVVQASEGEKFPRGRGLLKRLEFPIKWHITVLRLRDCQLRSEGGNILATFLRRNTTLRELDVYKNFLQESGGIAISDALRNNTTLDNLNISRNVIGGTAGRHFAQLLGKMPLKSLDIGHNSLTDEAICDFAAQLHSEKGKNTTLTSLAIGGSDLRGVGARELAETLRHNTTLTRLDLREALLTFDDVDSLVAAVQANTTLLELDLRSVKGTCQYRCSVFDLRPWMGRGGHMYHPSPTSSRIIV